MLSAPLLALGCFCFTSHLFLLFPRPSPLPCASLRGPTHTPSLGQARLLTVSALSLTLSRPQAVATPESRLPAAWGLGTDTEHGLMFVQEQTSGSGCKSQGTPAILERPVLITHPLSSPWPCPEHIQCALPEAGETGRFGPGALDMCRGLLEALTHYVPSSWTLERP